MVSACHTRAYLPWLNISAVSTKNDVPLRLSIKGDRTTGAHFRSTVVHSFFSFVLCFVVHLIRIERTNLVVVCKNSVKSEAVESEIEKTTTLLRTGGRSLFNPGYDRCRDLMCCSIVVVVASNLQDVWHMGSIR